MKGRISNPIWLLLASLSLLAACRELDDMTVAELPTYDGTPYSLSYGQLPEPRIAPDNPLRVEGVKLGRMLFYDNRLSRTGTMSCASCHKQENAFSDIRTFSLGVDELPGKRNAMSVVNMAWNTNGFFWDGRAPLLRDQALLPIQDHLEMDETLPRVVEKLSSEPMYRDQFLRAFGTSQITPLYISLALEQFMNSIVSANSKYDLYLRGEATFTAQEERGRELFFLEYNPGFPNNSGADCQHCHSGKNFEDDEYRNNGLDPDNAVTDLGYEEVTGLASDRAKFKVATLRNIALTAPYMHDSRFATLEEVVDHYNTGIHTSTTLDPALQSALPGGLLLTDQDKADLVAFLRTLTDEQLLRNPAYASPF